MQSEGKACENIYDEVSPSPPVFKFSIEDNGNSCNGRPAISRKNSANKDGGNRSIIIALIVALVLVAVLMVVLVAGVSISFSREIYKLRSEMENENNLSLARQRQDSSTIEGRLGSLNSSLDELFQQLFQDFLALENQTLQQDVSFNQLLNYRIELVLMEQLNNSQRINALINEKYLELNLSFAGLEARTNTKLEIVLAEQEKGITTAFDRLAGLNSSVSDKLMEISNEAQELNQALNLSFTKLLFHQIDDVQASLLKQLGDTHFNINQTLIDLENKFEVAIAEKEQSINNASSLLHYTIENIHSALLEQISGAFLQFNQTVSEFSEKIETIKYTLLAEQEHSIGNISDRIASFNNTILEKLNESSNQTQELNSSLTQLLNHQIKNVRSSLNHQLSENFWQINLTYTALESNSDKMFEMLLSEQEKSQRNFGITVQSLNSSVYSLLQLLSNKTQELNETLVETFNDLIEDVQSFLLEQMDDSYLQLNQTLFEHTKSADMKLEMASAEQKQSLTKTGEQIAALNATVYVLYQQAVLDSTNKSEILNESLSQVYNKEIKDILEQLNETYKQINQTTAELRNGVLEPGKYPLFPASSCAVLPPSSPSGYYWVRAFNGSAVRVYCYMVGAHSSSPVPSCAALPPFSPSGYYWVRPYDDYSPVHVYCDTTRSCGGITGGWMRVAHLDMTKSSHHCPSGLRQRTDSNRRSCVRNTGSSGCSSITYTTFKISYAKVCGKVIAYQVGTPDAFRHNTRSISSTYVDGVSLTHSNPKKHIWTFAAAHDENAHNEFMCKCMTSRAPTPPSYVGSDYFCDTAVSSSATVNTLYSSDPLWDGTGCGSSNRCCSFNTPPWFYKQLPQSTSDNIEMRVCRDESASNEDIALRSVELFVQ